MYELLGAAHLALPVHVPQVDQLIRARGGDRLAVGAELDAVHAVLVPAEHHDGRVQARRAPGAGLHTRHGESFVLCPRALQHDTTPAIRALLFRGYHQLARLGGAFPVHRREPLAHCGPTALRVRAPVRFVAAGDPWAGLK